ncbi:50S ribosomal protein L32 [Patescibacteria group bacterium]|nr:50S ribosomal protein L32 [Patescibacteria group bacterium]
MSVPAKKASRTQTRARRKTNMKIKFTKDNIENCPKCNKVKLQHRACSYCGYYK